ncbi:MAG: hypothetical protein IJU37_10670 [Desulfovibrio sp.]|nr:hypothetical protein [Desulfovibrio sp.]
MSENTVTTGAQINLGDIAKITKIGLESGKLYLSFVLNGLEDKEMQVQCHEVHIAEDGSSLTLGGFESNMPFLQNAFNRFAPKSIALPESAKNTVLMVKSLLGL